MANASEFFVPFRNRLESRQLSRRLWFRERLSSAGSFLSCIREIQCMSLRCCRERSLFTAPFEGTDGPLRLWSRQLPRHQSPLVCASRPSCPQVLGGPISIRFPVLRAEILSSARRAKAVVNPMSRIIPGTLRHGPLRTFRPMLHYFARHSQSSFRLLVRIRALPILSERVGFHLRSPCAASMLPLRSCQLWQAFSGRVAPSFA